MIQKAHCDWIDFGVFFFFSVDVEGSPLASSTHMGLEMKNPRCET